MRMQPCVARAFWAVLVCGALLDAAGRAHALPSVGSLSAPGGFVAACGGISNTTGAHVPGQDLEAFYLGTSHCTSESFTNGNVTTSALFDNGTIKNSASGTVGWGTMQFSAENISPNNEPFPYGSVTGGWEDTFTINAPGLVGQEGLMVYSVNVSGSWVLSGFAGAARISVATYKDDKRIKGDPVFAALNGLANAVGFNQGWTWASSFYPNGVNNTLFLTAPFVYGEAFDLGVFATLVAGLRSKSGVPGLSSSSADFSNSITWGGIHDILTAGQSIADYTVHGASGIDWLLDDPITLDPIESSIPEPDTYALVLLSMGIIRLLNGHQRRREAGSG